MDESVCPPCCDYATVISNLFTGEAPCEFYQLQGHNPNIRLITLNISLNKASQPCYRQTPLKIKIRYDYTKIFNKD